MKIVLLISLAATLSAIAVQDDLDTTFNPGLPTGVQAVAVQPDGKIVIGGGWGNIGGIPHGGIARLNAVTGAVEHSYATNITGGQVRTLRFRRDGKLYVGGSFDAVNGVSRQKVARLNADGTLDTTFADPVITPAGFEVYTLIEQSDGKIIIGGIFSAVNGTTRNNLARLNADGTLDTSYNPAPDADINSLVLLPNDQVLVGGQFTNIAGLPNFSRYGLAILNSDGTADATALPQVNIRNVLLQPDGKVVFSGLFSQIGVTKVWGLARMNTNRSLETTFLPRLGVRPDTNPSSCYSMALAADGKIILAGDFATIGADENGENGTARTALARINADGTLDTSLPDRAPTDPFNSLQPVNSVIIQPDGKLLVGGFFGNIGGVARSWLVRYEGGLPTQRLSVTNSNSRIEWLRGGAAPEAESVWFEQSTDAGATYTLLGRATSISGGWELTGLSLPGSVRIRATAMCAGAMRNASMSMAQTEEDFPLVPPQLVIEQPESNALANNATVDFGNVVSATSSSPFTFTLRNTGTGLLKRLQTNIEGAQPSEFAITPLSTTTLSTGTSTTFSITFTPGAQSARSATLRIASNDVTHSVFTINLTGTGIASPNADLTGMGLPSNTTLSPTFAANTLSYSANVIFNQTSIVITPSSVNPAATIRVNNVIVASGANSAPINLTTGSNTITIAVTAEDGVNTKTYQLNVIRAINKAPGDIDLGFNPYVGHLVNVMALQSDGRLHIGGFFTVLGAPINTAGSVTRSGMARINPDSSIDDWNPADPVSGPYAFHLLSNGQVITAGSTPTNPDPSLCGIALFNTDGTRVASFSGNTDAVIKDIAAVASGRFVVVGDFTSTQFGGATSATTRNRIARLNANGTLDPTFNPNADDKVNAVVVQADGKIIVGGKMSMVGSTAVNQIARLNTNGAVDNTFSAPSFPAAEVLALALQPDGKLLVGGVGYDGVVRLNTNGTLDSSFTPSGAPNGVVSARSIALQENGQVVMGGSASPGRSSLERLNADGSYDTTFQVNFSANADITRVLIDELGRIVIGGSFSSVNGLARTNLARIEGATTQTLGPVSGTLVEWSRPGLPVASAVAFDISPDSGTTWTSIDATGTRVGSVWQGTISTPLPLAGGLLRARATIPGGLYGEMSFLSTYTPPAAEIAIEQPVNNDRDDGDTINIGSLGLNVTNPTVFTLRNVGGQNLTNIAVTITGTNAAMFTLIDAPDATVAPLESTTFTVQAKLTTAGAKTATINIASSDADENPFNIVMNATGVAAVLPTATTLAASNVAFGAGTVPNIVDATLNGTVDAKGQLRDISFDYGLTTAYGSNIPATPATLSTSGATAVTADLHDLPPHTTYHFRVRADGDLGNALGINKTFTTPNHLPVAVSDTAINLPSAAVTIDVLNNDDDADNDTLTITAKTAVTPSTAGTVAIVSNQLVFTASAAFGTGPNTSATFGYTVSDGFGGTATASVSVTPGSASIDVPSVSLPSAGTTYPVQLTTVGSWAVTEALTWVTVSPSSGIGSRTVNVTLLPNTAIAARTGTVKIGGVSHTITQAGVLAPVVSPAVADTGSFNTVVGARGFSVSIPCTNLPVTFSVASGTLPPGLTLNSTTGIISGIPTAGGTAAAPTKAYPLTIKAANLKGSNITPSFTINVDALPAGVIGSWQGIVSPHATVHYTAAASLGARFELTTSGNGSFTASLYEGVTKKSVTGTLEVVLATKQTPTLNAVLPGTSLALALTLDGNTRTLTGTLSDTVNSTPVNAWRNTWTTTAPANKASAFMGLHNVYLANTDTLSGPQGYGYASFNIAENTGVLSITGKLADETKTTATPMTTTFVGPQGQVLLYLPLYGNRGSLCGTLTVDHSITGDNQVQGTLSWVKPAPLPTSTDTVYKSGFGPLAVAAEGNLYVAPGKGLRVMGAVPPVLPATTNSSLTFDLGGLAASFTQNVLIKNPSPTGPTNTASVTAFNAALTPNPNPNKVTMPLLTASSGLFSGSFIIAGTPARTAPYYGLIVRDVTAATDVTQGFGFFLLPTTPVPPLTVTTSPKLSGSVRFTAP